eukprot:scaffold436_cov188-Alexandrium_tamarense.AAC.4
MAPGMAVPSEQQGGVKRGDDVETESDLVSLENTLIRKSRRLIREYEDDYVMTGDEGRIVSNLWTTQ